MKHTARCTTCGTVTEHPTRAAATRWIIDCDIRDRTGAGHITQLPTVTFHAQALAAILTLARTGREFTVGEAHPMVDVQPLDPARDWPRVTNEAKDNGWIVRVGYGPSVVPGTHRSAVAIWRGTSAALKAVA